MKRAVITLARLLALAPAPLCGDKALITRFELPFKDKQARYFFSDEHTFYFGDQASRTIYRVKDDFTLEQIEDMKGWYIADACMTGGRVYFCSRQRILCKKNGKVINHPVPGTADLLSITAAHAGFYLLDENNGRYLIHHTNSDFGILQTMTCPGRQPADIQFFNEALWIYDIKTRCVIKFDPTKQTELFSVYTDADNSYSKGFIFFKGKLYIHNRGTSSLDLVDFKETETAVLSLPSRVTYRYVLESRNLSATQECRARFAVPVPGNAADQTVESLTWLSPPQAIKDDRYGQPVACFEQVIPAPGSFTLGYRAQAVTWAVRYKITELPLSALENIPEDIKKEYLADDSRFSMESPLMKEAALAARTDAAGNEPGGVKQLIENIARYIITRMEYNMDDTWENAGAVLKNGRGSCSEYSFVFSALARLNNIPTRLVGGIIIKDKENSFHRWTEVFYPGIGWVPVDVTALDSSDPSSWDFEFLFGKPQNRIVLSRMGGTDGTELGVEAYGAKRYSGGKRERKYYTVTESFGPLAGKNGRVIVIPAPET
jgi:hypothetical protein